MFGRVLDETGSALPGVTVPPVATIVTRWPAMGAPAVSRTSSTSAWPSADPTVPCSSAPGVNRVSGSDITGRGGGGGSARATGVGGETGDVTKSI